MYLSSPRAEIMSLLYKEVFYFNIVVTILVIVVVDIHNGHDFLDILDVLDFLDVLYMLDVLAKSSCPYQVQKLRY